METNLSENHKNVAAAIHLSTFSKYFFPFGNFILPLVLWTTNKEKPFVNEHGRQAINFQLSILVYTIVVGILCLPFFAIFASDFVGLVDAIDHHVHDTSFQDIKNLTGYVTLFGIVAVLLFGVFVFELYAVITATVHAQRGEHYKYPFSIPFIKTVPEVSQDDNQSTNEQANS